MRALAILLFATYAFAQRDIKLGPLPADSKPREPNQIGVHRKLPKEAQKAGKWVKLPNGDPVWRAAIRSLGAAAIRVHFTEFSVGAGKVWVYDGKQLPDDPFRGKGLYDKGDFWSNAVFGDRVVIEYQPPPDTKRPKTPPFRVTEISHQWKD